MILTIFRKDVLDAIRDARILVPLLLLFGVGLFYNFTFRDTPAQPRATVAYAAAERTVLPEALRAFAGQTVEVRLTQVAGAEEVRRLVDEEDADVGLIVPPGFDAALARGEAPPLTVILPESPGAGGRYITAALEPALRGLAGQRPPALVQTETLAAGDAGERPPIARLGPQRYFVLASIIMLVVTIGIYAVPVLLTEEGEKKTLDALVMIASYGDVIAAKALVGLATIALAVPLLLAMTRIRVGDPVLFVAAIALFSVAVIGLGLLLGGLFRNMNQLNTWGGLLQLPLFIPAFLVGLPLPGVASRVLDFLPTSQATKLAINGLAGEAVFPNAPLAFVVVAAWGALAYGLLLWRLSRREA
jgi:ABC-2 type transport system permease protein